MLSDWVDLYKDYGLYKKARDNLPTVAATVLAVIISGRVIRYLYTYNKLRHRRNGAIKEYQDLKQSWKRAALEKITEAESEKIVSMNFAELSSSLRQGHLTAVEVLRAYQRKAAVEDEKYNFVCEPLDPLEAERLAEQLDTIPVSERGSLPLFGIPLTVKESEQMAGYCSNMGISRLVGDISTQDSPRIRILRDFGAVPFIRTNVPQLLLAFSTDNPIYGRTVNPWNTSRDCGGSSGGEAAAIACGASILGLGSDIGGSLRIPSSWCGITAIKPTAGRVSSVLKLTLNDGQTCVRSTVGPMAPSVDALIAAMRLYFCDEMFEMDASIPKQLFNDKELNSERPLTIGLLEYDGLNDTSNACKRALKITAGILTAKGHKVVPYKLRDSVLCYNKYFCKAIFSDGGQYLCRYLYGDAMSADMKNMYRFLSLPLLVKKFINFFSYWLLPKQLSTPSKMMEGLQSLEEWFELSKFIDRYRYQVLDDWKHEELDAVICPAMHTPALPLGDSAYVKCALAYVTPWNVLNFPAGVVPICTVTGDDTAADAANFKTTPRDFMQSMLKRGLVGSEGLPMSVQLVTPPYQEERCLRLMKEVEAAAGFKLLTSRQH